MRFPLFCWPVTLNLMVLAGLPVCRQAGGAFAGVCIPHHRKTRLTRPTKLNVAALGLVVAEIKQYDRCHGIDPFSYPVVFNRLESWGLLPLQNCLRRKKLHFCLYFALQLVLIVESSHYASTCGFGRRLFGSFRSRASMAICAGLLFFAYSLSGPVPKYRVLTTVFNLHYKVT